jgi:hypothetical protein
MIPDEARRWILDALADLPSGPPGEEILAVLLSEAWARGEVSGRSYAMRIMSDEPGAPAPANPYRSAGAGE